MKISKMFRRKSLGSQNSEPNQEKGLNRVLNVIDLTMNGIAAIIGAGIFVLIGTVATAHSGPGIWMSFILSGLACACVAFSYAELTGMIHSSGSVYEYAYHTMGELLAFILGWSVLIAYSIGSAAVAVGLSGYLQAMLAPTGFGLPNGILEAPSSSSSMGVMTGILLLVGGILVRWLKIGNVLIRSNISGFLLIAAGTIYITVSAANLESINLVAAVTIALISLHLYHGVKESVKFTTFLSVIETSLVIIFIALTAGSIRLENLTPLMPFGPSGILSGAALIFFAYIGFDSITTMGDECQNPKRDLPRAIIWSLAVCTVLYILVGIGMIGAVSYLDISPNAPLSDVLTKIGYGGLVSAFSFGVLLSIESTLNVLLYAQSRIIRRMSNDGLLPERLGAVDRNTKTPHMAILLVAVVSGATAGLFPIGLLAPLVNIGVLAAFLAVCIAVIVMRYKHPEIERSFYCPMVPWVPSLGAIVSFAMMVSLGVNTWLLFGISTVIGLCIYLSYGYRNSALASVNDKHRLR